MDAESLKFDTCMTCGGPIEIHRPPHDMFFSHLMHPSDDHDAVPVALPLLRKIQHDSDTWFDAYNELRDKGDPSWDMFDAAVAYAVEAQISKITGRHLE